MKMKLFVILLLFTTSISLVNAQVGVNTQDPNKFTEFDVTNLVTAAGDTIPKGIMIPRMSTAKRDLIEVSTDTSLANGLFIYNTSENCYNYYNKSVGSWQSMCGSYKNAVFKMSDCSSLQIYGNYVEGVGLGSDQYITLDVTVTAPGTYSITAETKNNYFFQSSGVFPSAGTYSIKLQGTGTPTAEGINAVTLFNNGMALACVDNAVCTQNITVGSSMVTYTIRCEKTVIAGKYTSDNDLDETNTITIPIIPKRPGLVSFNTTSSNGVYFTVNQQIDMSTTEIIMVGRGTPAKGGSYNFSYTTNGANPTKCDFTIKFSTSWGTYEHPATSCLQILNDDADATDGEYFIAAGSTPTLTLCDMTNGGYTLIESFSEYSFYGAGQTTGPNYTVLQGTQNFSTNAPRGMANAQVGPEATIDYEMYRLPSATMITAAGGAKGNLYRVRTVENIDSIATSDDRWARNNNYVFDFRQSTVDFLTATWSAPHDVKITAKVFGHDLTLVPNSANQNKITYNNGTPWVIGGAIGIWNATNARVLSLSDGGTTPPNQPFTYISSNGATVTANFNQLNDLAHPYVAETQINHHFGKCGNATADDYVGVATCTNAAGARSPHRFNKDSNGNFQGRYLQWFVK